MSLRLSERARWDEARHKKPTHLAPEVVGTRGQVAEGVKGILAEQKKRDPSVPAATTNEPGKKLPLPIVTRESADPVRKTIQPGERWKSWLRNMYRGLMEKGIYFIHMKGSGKKSAIGISTTEEIRATLDKRHLKESTDPSEAAEAIQASALMEELRFIYKILRREAKNHRQRARKRGDKSRKTTRDADRAEREALMGIGDPEESATAATHDDLVKIIGNFQRAATRAGIDQAEIDVLLTRCAPEVLANTDFLKNAGLAGIAPEEIAALLERNDQRLLKRMEKLYDKLTTSEKKMTELRDWVEKYKEEVPPSTTAYEDAETEEIVRE